MPTENYAPIGAELTVNTTYARSQAQSDAAKLADGNFIVTWIDADFNTTAGRYLRAQVYSPDGVALGGEKTLATLNGGIQPSVAGLAGGGWVVAWISLGSITAQVFDATGTAIGTTFTVTPGSGVSGINRPDVAALAGGGFAIVWDDGRTAGGDISGQGVHLRVFGATGTPVGGDALVNTQTSRNQADASIAALADGGWVVTWTDRGASNGWVIKAQIYSAAGARVGTEMVVNSTSGFISSVESSVTTLANGNFAVAWYEGSAHHVQVFTPAGVRVGTETSIASNLGGTQTGPVIAALADGGYAVAWTRDGAGTADGSGRAVYMQAYTAAGEANGAATLVNSQANGDQLDASIVGLSNGKFAISWTDLAATGADDDQVKMQIFGHPVPIAITSAGGGDTAAVSVAENGQSVAAVSATGGSGAIAYTIVGGADAALFRIDAATGALSFAAAPNYEAPADADGDNVYQVVVSAGDGTSVDTQALSVTVTNVNEAPAIVSGGGGDRVDLTIAENSGNVLVAAASDPDGTVPQIGIAGGADAALFELDPVTHVLRFKDLPDYETRRDADGDNVYVVILGATDGQYFDTQTIYVTVADAYEGISWTSAPGAVSVSENGTAAGGVAASGVEGRPVHYAITGGADALRFTIDETTGALSFVSAPDFEAAGDADGDNVYSLFVSASDGVSTIGGTVTVTVANVDEAVAISSYGGAGSVAFTMAENGWRVGTIAASDPDGYSDPIVYSIAGGADAALFCIDPVTGALSFIFDMNADARPDFEHPADANADNVYDVVVAASNSTSSASQSFAITIVNQNEGIFIASNGGGTSASIMLDEGTRTVTTVVAADPDGTAATYSIVGGPDAERFTIDALTGVLSFVDAPDFEAPADAWGNNFYTVEVGASDGEYTTWQKIQIGIRNVNEGLAISSYDGADVVIRTVAEGTQAAARVEAVDRDGDPLTYTISGGADAARFAIDAATGALRFVSAPDYEAPADSNGDNRYLVEVTASDGQYGDVQAFEFVIADANEPLTIVSNGGGAAASLTVNENDRTVQAVRGSDPEGGTITYSIAGGTDASRFMIDAATGALAFVSAPDFEAPADAGGDNVYDVVVAASDGTFTAKQTLAIRVGDLNEAVTITSNGGGSSASLLLAEGVAAVTTVKATDADGGTIIYAIAGGADAARFRIDANGALSFVSTPDFEAPADAGANNVYDVVVSASDGTFTDTQALAIRVTDVNEAVTITSNGGGVTASVSVAENGRSVTTVTAADPDGPPATYSIVGGADAARFTIDPKTGLLQFVSAPDYELPADANGDNVYVVTVQASDGTFADSQTLSVSVSNLRDGVTITGTSGNDSISSTSTSASLRTTNAEDVVSGGGGHDTILGLGGDDYLSGDAGNDDLTGGAGADRLTGGLGKDNFIYNAVTDSAPTTRDFIADFNRSQGDKINLSAIDANVGLASNQAFTFIGTSAFSGVAGQLRFEQVGGATFVSGDVNGDGIADLQIELSGSIALIASDFVL